MNRIATLLTIAAGAALGGCSASGATPATPSRVCNLAANVLQFNVGTANLFADTPAFNVIGTNVAVTYRQSASANCFVGNSGSLVSTPTLTVPQAIPGPGIAVPGTPNVAPGLVVDTLSTILTGPSKAEVNTTSMTGTSQTPNVANVTTFGQSGGAFGIGLEPFNYVGVGGSPATNFPYPVPLYDTINAGGGVDLNQFTPGGGLPAFNPAGNTAAVIAGFNGISEGLDVFALAPVIGPPYALTVSVPANTGTVTQTASASISNTTLGVGLLPAITPGVPTAYTAATGSATFAYTVPPAAGISEVYVQVTDIGPDTAGGVSCIGAMPAKPVFYTFFDRASGSQTISGTATAPAICSSAANTAVSPGVSNGDEFTVQTIGFDYDAYGASYPNSLGKPNPSLANNFVPARTSQADVTVSSQTEYTLPATNVPTLVPMASRIPQGIRRR